MKFFILIVVTLFGVCNSYMCLLNPYQRGGAIPQASLNKAGSEECGRTSKYCGGVNSNNSEMSAFFSGDTIVIALQKNLDHYNSANPGNFTIHLFQNSNPKLFGSVQDSSYGSLSIYEVSGTIPADNEGLYTLQVKHTHVLLCLQQIIGKTHGF